MYPKQEISGTSPVPSAFILKPVRFDTTSPSSGTHSNDLGPKIQEAALSITQMFASQASRITWKRFYTLTNIWKGEGSRKHSLWGENSGSWIHSVSVLKPGTVPTEIISSDILFTRARFNKGLMRMKGLGQRFQAGIPGGMWRGSISITSCQHELCQTQFLHWELTQGLRLQHKWKWKQSLQQAHMDFSSAPQHSAKGALSTDLHCL